MLADLADDGVLNQSDGSDYSDNTAIDGSIPGLTGFIGKTASEIEEQTGVTCFTKGTLITTERGDVPVETLVPGDRVLTLDRGYQPLQLSLCRTIGLDALRANPKLLPVRIAAGSMGAGLPKRDLRVSRQHRMAVKSRIGERMFGAATVLVAAIKLTEMPRIEVDHAVTQVDYFHLLFDNHEVIYAEGTPSESFFLGPETRKTVPTEAWEEITTLFPAVADLAFTPIPAPTIPPNAQQKQLVRRHCKNKKPLIATVSR
ncbi:Hint domain-containing protein [Yoonia sp. I 8.24]|uniref:Hint domain-containing protein n=1 Tax=Yoonia sp. I 8.24 TaxID=1537229 RepID=UPI001EDE7DCD|nr:Hint domain-containing protein [Yoonia sp. I 8.24]MCG3267483.1 Hint domain-containing protein [Yoonia sp. I 8.24]